MPGRNDWSAGFTKSAQKTKYIRNRDVKMKDSEVRKEAHINKAMCEGICRRCIEKVQWKFHYDKYKPLKNVANCKNCKQKVITKAYRTFCDKCAATKKVCPGCCVDLAEANKPLPENIRGAAAKNAILRSKEGEEEEGSDEDEAMSEEGDVTAAQAGGENDQEPDDEAEEMEDGDVDIEDDEEDCEEEEN